MHEWILSSLSLWAWIMMKFLGPEFIPKNYNMLSLSEKKKHFSDVIGQRSKVWWWKNGASDQ